MQNIDKEVQTTALKVTETEERLTWRRPALRRVGSSQAEMMYGGYAPDGYYYS